jgi:2'-5' RNA ligase
MRLFVAVWPPGPVLDLVADLPRPAVVGLRWTSREQWHVTLRFLGRVEDPAPVVEALVAAAASVPGPITAVLGPETGRFGQRVLHVPVSGLEPLADAVVAATAGFGEPPEDRPFHGHLTLARARARVDLRPLCGIPVSATWPVTTVALVRSDLHPHGARYTDVAVAPLGGQNHSA